MEADVNHLAALVAAEVVRALRAGPAEPPPGSAYQREGEFWRIVHEGRTVLMRDSRGLQHLGVLLRRPGTPVHCLELAGGVPAQRRPEPGLRLLVLDAAAKAAYRRRVAELDAEVADAADCADSCREQRARDERDLLLQELARAVGLAGRDRAAADPVERARVAVTKAIRSAVRAIRAHHPSLGQHLVLTVRTGTFCCYSAEPAPTWSG